jgi:hypothetical protein
MTLKADQRKLAPTYKSELGPRFQKNTPETRPPHGNAPPLDGNKTPETRVSKETAPTRRKNGIHGPAFRRKHARNTAPTPMFPPCFRRNKATEPLFRGNKTPSPAKRCREPCFYIRRFISRLLQEINWLISSKQAVMPRIGFLTGLLVHFGLAAPPCGATSTILAIILTATG